MSGRQLEFQFLYNPRKLEITHYNARCGDKVVWSDDEKVLFQGYIEYFEYDTDNDTIKVNCRDCLSYLKRSKFIGRYRGTINEIADKICGEFGLQNAIKSDSTEIFNYKTDDNMSFYDILFQSCQKMYGQCYLYIENNTLKVEDLDIDKIPIIEAEFLIGKNIRKSVFSQDISKLVTRIYVIDNENKISQIIEDPELRSKFGLFQDIYNYNTDDKKKLLTKKELKNNIQNEAKIVADNNNRCVTGKFIRINEPYNDIKGDFKIKSDKHIIGMDSYMILELELHN